MSARFYVCDVFDGLATLEDGSVDLVVTSPPFLALRSYLPADHPDKGKEIGSEATPAEFIDVLLRVILGGPQRNPVLLCRARQVVLREVWPIHRRSRVGAAPPTAQAATGSGTAASLRGAASSITGSSRASRSQRTPGAVSIA